MDFVTILLPHGQTVMIHKGWQPCKHPKFTSTPYSDAKVRSVSGQCSQAVTVGGSNAHSSPQGQKREYSFINSKSPRSERDPEVLKTIRRHVRRELIRNTKQGKASKEENSRTSCLPRDSQLPIFGFDKCSIAPSTSFSEYPIEMQPHTHALLSKYLTYASSRMFPIGSSLKRSPLKSPEWLHFAVTDEAMFHAMLYAAAMYLALLEDRTESRDTLYHQNRTISILQRRLRTSSQSFDDSTLGAISCLAIGGVSLSPEAKYSSLTFQAISGNVNIWHMHMRGLKQMIRSGGSFSSLSPLLQAKLRRKVTPVQPFHQF
jgi:Fungal specific transcription factor domain